MAGQLSRQSGGIIILVSWVRIPPSLPIKKDPVFRVFFYCVISEGGFEPTGSGFDYKAKADESMPVGKANCRSERSNPSLATSKKDPVFRVFFCITLPFKHRVACFHGGGLSLWYLVSLRAKYCPSSTRYYKDFTDKKCQSSGIFYLAIPRYQ